MRTPNSFARSRNNLSGCFLISVELSIGLKGFIKIIAHVLKLQNISTKDLSSKEDFVDTFNKIMKDLKPDHLVKTKPCHGI